MRPRFPHDDPVSRARKRIVHNALMVLAFGGTLCILLGFGIWQGLPAFMFFKYSGRFGGYEQPLTSLIIATGLATSLFLWELYRSWRKYREIHIQRTLEDTTYYNHKTKSKR